MKTIIKNILNVTWKVGLCLFGLGVLLIGLLLARVYWEETYGPDSYTPTTLSESVVTYGYNDDTERAYNVLTGRFTTPKLAWISSRPLDDSLTVYADRKGEYRGFLNVNTGEIALNSKEFRFRRAWFFSEGVAFVQGENGKLGVIDHNGNYVIPCTLPFEPGEDYVFKGGLCRIIKRETEDEEPLQGLLRKDGTWALPMQFSRVGDANGDGYRVVADRNGEMLLDKDLVRVFSEHYDDISFAEGGGVYLTKDHKKKLVDYKGNILQPFVVSNTFVLKYVTRYHENEEDEYEADAEIMGYQVDQWEGLLDRKTGKPLTPAIYWRVNMISKDLFSAQLAWGEDYVLLNRKGQVIKP